MDAVRCIRCGASAADEVIAVDVDNAQIKCQACDESYTVAEVEKAVAAWAALLPWLKSHPALSRQAK